MYNKKGRRAAAFLGMLLTLTLCLGTLLEGFAFAETTGDTQTTQTEGTTAEENNVETETPAEGDGTESEAKATPESEDAQQNSVTEPEYAKTAALVITGNGATAKSSKLYAKTTKTSEVGITVTYDTSKDESQMDGYEVTDYSLWDVTDSDATKHVAVKDTKGADSFKIGVKVTFSLTNGHKYEARAIATEKVAAQSEADSETPEVAESTEDTASAEVAGVADNEESSNEAIKLDESGNSKKIASKSTYSLTVPAQVQNVKASCASKDNLITITWDKADGANTYYVYRTTSTSKPDQNSPIKTVTNATTYSERRQGGSYYYWILPVNTDDQTVGAMSSASGKVTAGNYLACNARTYWFTAKTKKKVPIYKSATSKKKVGYLAKGTTFTILKKSPKVVAQYGKVKRVYFEQNGKKGWVTYSSVKKTDHVSGRYNDWSKSFKEEYVNGKNSTGKMFTSSTNYLIWLSKYTQKVNVFKKNNGKWELIKTYRCSTGTFTHPTPTNLNYIIIRKQSIRHRVTNTGLRYYYKYLSAFGKKGSSGKGNAFHTICWNTGSNKPQKKVKDRPDTKGCARMFTSEAYWIYKNVPNKTRVVSY